MIAMIGAPGRATSPETGRLLLPGEHMVCETSFVLRRVAEILRFRLPAQPRNQILSVIFHPLQPVLATLCSRGPRHDTLPSAFRGGVEVARLRAHACCTSACAPLRVHLCVCTSVCAPLRVHLCVCTSACAPLRVHLCVCTSACAPLRVHPRAGNLALTQMREDRACPRQGRMRVRPSVYLSLCLWFCAQGGGRMTRLGIVFACQAGHSALQTTHSCWVGSGYPEPAKLVEDLCLCFSVSLNAVVA